MSFENVVVGGCTHEFPIVYAHAFYGALKAGFSVGYAYDFLVEHALDAFTCDIELRAELVAASEGRFIVEGHLGYHEVVTCSTHVGKTETDGEEELMARVL